MEAVYEYIVFRGSDVKELSIEDPPKEAQPAPPQVPNDPAILGVSSALRSPHLNWTTMMKIRIFFSLNHICRINRCLPSEISPHQTSFASTDHECR